MFTHSMRTTSRVLFLVSLMSSCWGRHINYNEVFWVDSGTEMTRALPIKSRFKTATSLTEVLLRDPRKNPAARFRKNATSIILPGEKERGRKEKK